MIRDTFLSVDLDYWGPGKRVEFTNFVKDALSYCKRKKIAKNYVFKHHEILPILDKCEFTRLVNVDYHSDIGNTLFENGYAIGLRTDIYEGNWVSHVNKNKRKKYEWCYPTKNSLVHGICHNTKFEPDPFAYPNEYGWDKITSCLGYKNLDFDTVCYVCFSISMDYWNLNENCNIWSNKFVDTYKSVLHKIMAKKDYIECLQLALNKSDLKKQLLGLGLDGSIEEILINIEKDGLIY